MHLPRCPSCSLSLFGIKFNFLYSESCADVGALGSTSLEPARENVETLYQRGICIPSELLRSPHFDRPEIYILNVQKVWIESKKGNILQRQHQALPSRGLVDGIMMWPRLKVLVVVVVY